MTGPWLGTFAAAVLVVGLAMLGLALGQLRGRAPLRGSCGGACDVCAEARCGHPRPEKR